MRLINFLNKFPVELDVFVLVNALKTKLLVLQNIKNNTLFYIKVPCNIVFLKKPHISLIFYSSKIESLNFFLKILSKQVCVIRFPFYIKLFLKGLGFRIKLVDLNEDRFLEFKLGFSHIIALKICSKNISVVVKKNSLILSGFSKTEVGNLANYIYNLRAPNVYTGKGFRYKRIPLKLKDVKKT